MTRATIRERITAAETPTTIQNMVTDMLPKSRGTCVNLIISFFKDSNKILTGRADCG